MEKTITVKIKIESTIELRFAIRKLTEIIDLVGVQKVDMFKVK